MGLNLKTTFNEYLPKGAAKICLKNYTNIVYNGINKQYQKPFAENLADILVKGFKRLQKKSPHIQTKTRRIKLEFVQINLK